MTKRIPRINQNQKYAVHIMALWILRRFPVDPLYALDCVFNVRERINFKM
jgi:hypothetical protein